MNSSIRPQLSLETVREAFVDILQQSAPRVPGWLGALVATVDGRQVAVQHSPSIDSAKVATMVGSVVALGETVCRELKFGRSQNLIVAAATGMLLALRVPARREVLLLGVLASSDAILGMVLHEARSAAQRLGEYFDAAQSPKPLGP